MLNLTNMMSIIGDKFYAARMAICITLIVLMAVAALAAIVLVMLQPANSSGIDALGGSSETFFGKNKGKSIEAQMKKWTWICLAVLAVLSVVFFIFAGESIWSK